MHNVEAVVARGSRDDLYGLLQHCISNRKLEAGKKVHHAIVCKGLDTVPILMEHLLRLYTSCGHLPEGRQMFEFARPSLFTYNAIISAYAKHGDDSMAFNLLNRLLQNGLNPDKCTFLCLLNISAKAGALQQGNQIHHWIIQMNLQLDVAISNTIIDMYAKCGSLHDSQCVFDQLSVRNDVTWAAVIAGHTYCGDVHSAMQLFRKMQLHNVKPNVVIYSCILKACSELKLLQDARSIHDEILWAGLEADDVILTALIDAYMKCNSSEDAHLIFGNIETDSIAPCNAMIGGLAQYGDDASALILFERLLQKGFRPDNITLLGVVKGCGNKGNIEGGRAVHHFMINSGLKSGITLENSLIDMYARCGHVFDAHAVFTALPNPDVISWGAVINGCAENDQGFLAIQMFDLMQERFIMPNEMVFVSALKACISIGLMKEGQRIHDQVIRNGLEVGTFIGSTIIDMYSKFGNVDEASNCFDRQIDPDVVAWGGMISGYVQVGFDDLATDMFVEMLDDGVKPSEIIFVSILQASINLNSLELGNLVHAYIVEAGFEINGPIGNALVDMYARRGRLDDALVVFNVNQNKDVVTWGAMIAGYAKHGHFFPALDLLMKMQSSQTTMPNRAIFLSLLKACSISGIVIHAMKLHSLIIEAGFDSDVKIRNALVDLYIKCGNIKEAYQVLCNLRNWDVVSWNHLISHDTECGHHERFAQYFAAMENEGLNPDNAIFTNILTACCHAGTLEKGLQCFILMMNGCGITPTCQHFYTVADLLVRAGLFNEAQDILITMPESANIVGWTSLLSGCRRYNNVEVGQRCLDIIADFSVK